MILNAKPIALKAIRACTQEISHLHTMAVLPTAIVSTANTGARYFSRNAGFAPKESAAARESSFIRYKWARKNLLVNARYMHSTAVDDKPSKKLTVILDLDECLIHTPRQQDSLQQPRPTYGDRFQVKIENLFEGDEKDNVIVYKRPGLDNFLREMSSQCRIFAFTASLPEYANSILDHLDPHKVIFTKRFFRDHCQFILTERSCVKDLSMLGINDLSRVVLVDNNLVSFLPQPENGIPIRSWFDNPEDKELHKVQLLIERYLLTDDKDVRPTLKDIFELRKVLEKKYSKFIGQNHDSGGNTVHLNGLAGH